MEDTELKTERAWIELNMENLRHNVQTLKKAILPECELMAVVKANAYGHGAREISISLNKMGITAFAVATIGEGIRLRKCGVRGEILILGYTDVRRVHDLKKYDLIQTLIDVPYAEALNSRKTAVKVHIKIDTGMHRLGIPVEALSEVKKVFEMAYLNICGMYTHLCCADSRLPDDMAFTGKQIDSFYDLTDALRDSGISVPKVHIQSSYGLLNYPYLACDYIRAGIALYGVLSAPGDETKLKPDLRPVLSLKSRVVSIKSIKKGDSVGYGRDFVAGRDGRIAIIPVGYGDGFPRNLSDTKSYVRIKQYAAPIVGRICMDQLAADITDAEPVAVGDIVTLAGGEGDDGLSAPVVADRAGSISNEFLCRMGERLPVVIVSPGVNKKGTNLLRFIPF